MLVAAVYRGPEKVRTGVEARGIYVVVLGEVAHFVVLFISVPFFFFFLLFGRSWEKEQWVEYCKYQMLILEGLHCRGPSVKTKMR